MVVLGGSDSPRTTSNGAIRVVERYIQSTCAQDLLVVDPHPSSGDVHLSQVDLDTYVERCKS